MNDADQHRPTAYRKLEAGERWPSWETYDRIAAAFGWPQTSS
jgi:DNA-binding XRE family transcriptional regulator